MELAPITASYHQDSLDGEAVSTRLLTCSAYLLYIEILFGASFVQLDTNLVCELLCILCLDNLLFWTVILVAHCNTKKTDTETWKLAVVQVYNEGFSWSIKTCILLLV